MSENLITSLPFEITEPGLYRLDRDLTAPIGEYALKVSAANVTLNMDNGRIQAKGQLAILLNAPDFHLYEGELISEGVAIASSPDCRAHNSRFSGLDVRGDIHLPSNDLVFEGCNLGGWSYGVHAGSCALVSNCEVRGGTLGIEVGPGSTVVGCKVRNCEDGVYALGMREQPCLLERLDVAHCRGLGVRLDGPGKVVGCRVRENGTELASGGILAGPGAEVIDCLAIHNSGGDINVVEPCKLANNRTTE